MDNNQNLLEMIHAVSRSLRRHRSRPQDGKPVYRGGFRILKTLEKEGPLHLSILAEKLDIRPSSLSEALDRLQQREMIERNTDNQDKRKIIVSLSQKARDKMDQRKEFKDETLLKIQSALTVKEQEEYIRLSQKIVDAIK